MTPAPLPTDPTPAPFTVTGQSWQPHRSFRLSRLRSRPGPRRQRPWRWRWLGGVAAVAALAATGGAAGAKLSSLATHPAGTRRARVPVEHPPPLQACVTSLVPCYGQDRLHRVYHLSQLYAHGITGTGTSVALVVPYVGVSPRLRADLAVFSHYLRLPPMRLTVLSYGHPSPARPETASAGWAREDIADAELVHAMAPAARLLCVQVPLSPPTSGMTALGWLATHQHVDVASFSWGDRESDLTRQQLPALRAGLLTAVGHGVSVVAASGDSGPTSPTPRGGGRHRTVVWPASDPLVTGVGALCTYVNTAGNRARPDTVIGGPFATCAGRSAFFSRPAYQRGGGR